jgi:hypothetical protein
VSRRLPLMSVVPAGSNACLLLTVGTERTERRSPQSRTGGGFPPCQGSSCFCCSAISAFFCLPFCFCLLHVQCVLFVRAHLALFLSVSLCMFLFIVSGGVNIFVAHIIVRRDSLVGIATDCGLDD